MGYGSEIKALIKGNGMTIKELSEKSGVSINTLYSITKRDSKRIDEDTRSKISAVIDIPPVATWDNGLAVRLRELRKHSNESQADIAKELSVSKSTVGLWESGATQPNAESLYNIARHYGVSADYLLGITESPSLDADVRSAQEYTGLSDRAVKSLTGDAELVEAVNYLLSREKGIEAIKGVYSFLWKF